MIRLVYKKTIVLLMLGVTVACASNPSGSGQAARRNASVISAEEIQQSDARDAYELVERLRPLWLQSRGDRSRALPTDILVYVNGAQMGTIGALRTIPRETIGTIRYLDGPAASAQLTGIGSRHVEGAIVISTRGSI